jgi:hypothetical protein
MIPSILRTSEWLIDHIALKRIDVLERRAASVCLLERVGVARNNALPARHEQVEAIVLSHERPAHRVIWSR